MNNVPCIKNLFSDSSNKFYDDLRICTRLTDSCGIACSAGVSLFLLFVSTKSKGACATKLYGLFVCIKTPWQVQGGGVIGVVRIEDQIRNPPVVKLKGHTSNILDVQFNPCFSEVIASSSEDLSIRIWEIPHKDKTIREIKNPLCILKGHKKKVTILDWNPINYYILSSSAFDSVVNIWDIENEKKAFQLNTPKKLTSLKWNVKGSLLSGTCINKYMHIIDPRKKEICHSFYIHNGGKSTKNMWIDGYSGNDDYILSTGFSKNNMREMKLWDLKNTSIPLLSISIDNASSPLLPHYDESIGIIYLIGKGDGNCRYYQHSEGFIRKVGEYKSCLPFKSFGFLPKQVCDVYKCEIGRVYKNENDNSIKPISFYVPRKNPTRFQEDLYPPIIMHDPNYNSKHWIDGIDTYINRISIKDLTQDDLKITKKFKWVPNSFDSIIIQDPVSSKKSSIIKQLTRKFTFFRKNDKHNVFDTDDIDEKSSLRSSEDSRNIRTQSFKEQGLLKEDGANQFYKGDRETSMEKDTVSAYVEDDRECTSHFIDRDEDINQPLQEKQNRSNINKCLEAIRNIKFCKRREKHREEV
ncbi:coronin [Plasmodium ovale wallikeri]|uniref:Coronin n=1 Tax=Plasmodium ovale wallikeri TaxID=864142 RepID=A0A1A9A3F4_PLAOA|nr:coronin [Plasmodium ovale wallikeri]SBT50978.1 coronin [Plasmodium ovale wallikeri]